MRLPWRRDKPAPAVASEPDPLPTMIDGVVRHAMVGSPADCAFTSEAAIAWQGRRLPFWIDGEVTELVVTRAKVVSNGLGIEVTLAQPEKVDAEPAPDVDDVVGPPIASDVWPHDDDVAEPRPL